MDTVSTSNSCTMHTRISSQDNNVSRLVKIGGYRDHVKESEEEVNVSVGSKVRLPAYIHRENFACMGSRYAAGSAVLCRAVNQRPGDE